MATRVLIINRQLVFAVTIKQALEQTGLFVVHPFTTPDAAFDYLRDHPQDAALVDFNLPGRSGHKIVQQLRTIQPDLAVIITPRQPDAEALMSSLNIQGMIDAPFTARELIPVIQQAVEGGSASAAAQPPLPQTKPLTDTKPLTPPPLPAQTRILDSDPSLPAATTRSLGDDPNEVRQPYGTTRLLGMPSDDDDFESSLSQTRVFDDDQPTPPQPAPPVEIPDQDQPSPIRRIAQTRDLEEDFDLPEPPIRRIAQTRDLEEDFDLPEPPIRRTAQTRHLDDLDDEPEFSSAPHFSPLDSILQTFTPEEFLEEPLLTPEDTPSVPETTSEAVRQYLATGDPDSVEDFDDVLDAIDPNSAVPSRPDDDPFLGLVASLAGGDRHQSLPDRQSNRVEFNVTSSMDSVLREIEKAKTGPLPQTPSPRPSAAPVSEQLAAEEPPPPTLEENGTVGDLMMGVADRSFRNVLAMLSGTEVEESTDSGAGSRYAADFDALFGAPDTLPEDPAPAPPRPAPPIARPAPPPAWSDFDFLDDDSDEESVASVVLKTALDQSASLDEYSLDQVMNIVESELAQHRLQIKPLPSWGMDTSAFRPVVEADLPGVAEPDFLPEFFPESTRLTPAAPPDLPEFEPSGASGRTTQPSAASQEAIQAPDPDGETAAWSGLDDTRPVQPQTTDKATALPVEASGWDEPISPPDEAFDWDELPAQDETAAASPPAGFDELFDDLFNPPTAEPEAMATEQPPDWLPEIDPAAERGPEAVFNADWSDEPVFAAEAPLETDWSDEPVFYPEIEPDTASDWSDEPAFVAQTSTESADALPDAVMDEETDPRIAQLALNLTQYSLESSAEGTLLTQGGEIIAFAGHLAPEDISDLQAATENDWDAENGARFRFVTLPSSGKDFLLYSIRTHANLTLSMVFAGTTPLRTIREQGRRLAQALQTVPDVAEPPAAVIEVEAAEPQAPLPVQQRTPPPTSAYAYIWLLRDPNASLGQATMQAIHAGLSTQLSENDWRIHTLDVQQDYVYLLADVPGEQPPHEVMRDLKRRSAEIAHAQSPEITPALLWADSYFVLLPGRPLQTEEIHNFINMQRML